MSLFGDSNQSLNITIKAKDDASAALNKVRLSITDIAKGSAIGALAVQGLTSSFRFLEGFVTDSIKEFEDYNQAVAQTNAVLASTQHAAGLTAEEVISLSKAISENTLYQDDMVLSAENLLLTFTNITKETFPQATQAVLDMSTALGQDLQSSATQLGKALNNPIDGIASLTRVGIQFTGSQQDLITSLVKSGRTLEAQNLILDELEKKFGNSAKSAYDAASSITKLQKNVKDLEQDVGAGLTPALNNLFGAFQDTTAGMGRSVNVGKLVFKTFTAIEEVAVAAGVGIHTMAASLVNLGVTVVKLSTQMTGIDSVMSAFGVNSNQFFDDWTSSLHEQVDATSGFYFNLKNRNDAVIDSWGDVTVAAGTLGKAGPAAYQATAAEAKAAADQIKKTEKAIADTKKTLDDYRKDLTGETSNVADLFVQQEQKVSELKAQLEEARNAPAGQFDVTNVQKLQSDYDKEAKALQKAKASGVESQLPTQFAEARRRAGETDFERSIEDVFTRVADKGAAFKQGITYQITFGDAVVGDEGIKRVITDTIAAINRQAALSGTAGR